MGKRKVGTPRITKNGSFITGSTSAFKSSLGRASSIEKQSMTMGGGVVGGGSYPTSQTPSNFYSPELTVESFLLPKSRQEILKWQYRGGESLVLQSGVKKIEDVVVGDLVLSSSGKWQKVTATSKKMYTASDEAGNEWTKLKVQCLPEFTVGAYHPITAIKRPQPQQGKDWRGSGQYAYKQLCSKIKETVSTNTLTIPEIKVDDYLQTAFTDQELDLSDSLVQWVSPKKLEVGDFVVYPKFKATSSEESPLVLNEQTSYFYGWYVAEGYANEPTGVFRLTGNLNEREEFERLGKIITEALGVNTTVKNVAHCKNAVQLQFHSRALAPLFKEQFGHGARNKKVPSFIMNASPEIVKSFLQGYFKGDGSFTKNVAGLPVISCSTVSENLAYQINLLLTKINVLGSLTKYDTKGKSFKFKDKELNVASFVYYTTITGEMCGRLFDGYENLEATETKSRVIKYLEDDKNFYLPVREVTTYAEDAWGYDLQTEDHTYVAPVLVHNCRIFFNLEAYIQSIIMMHADYPFSKFDIITEDPSVTEFYKDVAFSETFDLYDFIRRASLSYWKFGEAIPFGSMIKDEEDGKWKWEKFILLEPELIEIRQEMFEGEPRFELVPTEELKQIVKASDPVAVERRKNIPEIVLESINNNRLIPLDSACVSQIGRITDPSATRGTPIIQSLFKILIYQDWIRLAQAAFAQRYVFPVELWTIGDAAAGVWPTEDELETFKNTINLAVQNPPFALVFPPVVKYESLTTSGKSYFPEVTNQYQYIHDQILVGLGVNKNLILGEGPSFCVPAEDRALTRNGLKYYWQITETDELATLNPKTNQLEYQRASRINVFDHDGEMIHFKTQKIDHMVTPNHRCWVKPQTTKKDKDRWQFVEADKVSHRAHFQLGMDWVGSSPSSFVDVLGKQVPIEDYLEWVGYWLAEGYVTYKEYDGETNAAYQVGFSQSLVSRYFNDFERLVEKLPFKVNKYTGTSSYKSQRVTTLEKDHTVVSWAIGSKDLAQYFIDNFGKGAFNKRIPQWIKDLSPKYLKILRDAMMKGDGSIHKATGKSAKAKAKYFTYHTVSTQLAEDVVEISLKLKDTPHMSLHKTTAGNDIHHVCWSEKKNASFILDRSGIKGVGNTPHTSRVSYKGKVWCPTTPNSTWVVERGGRFIITGNSNARTMSLHKLMMVYKAIRDQFENWMIKNFFRPLAVKNDLYKIVRGKKKYILPTISWYKSLDLEEREVERKLYFDMWGKGIISTKTLFGKFADLDYETEGLHLEKERGTVFDKGDKRLPQGVLTPMQGRGTPATPGMPELGGEVGAPSLGGGPEIGPEAPPAGPEAPSAPPTGPEIGAPVV